MKIKPAPKPSSGEVIELQPLLGKAIAVVVKSTREVETKFGVRPLAEVVIYVEGSDEPLEGVLFQSYFTKLPLNEPVAGILRHEQIGNFSQWFLDSEKLTKRQAAALEKLLETPADSDIPF